MDTTGAKTKLRWRIQDREFEDGSQLKQWRRIENTTWIPQPDGYELTFSIYEHAGGFWKLYRARLRTHEGSYANSYGGQACQVAEVRYRRDAISPHSSDSKLVGECEWVRVEEVDPTIHDVIRETPEAGAKTQLHSSPDVKTDRVACPAKDSDRTPETAHAAE